MNRTRHLLKRVSTKLIVSFIVVAIFPALMIVYFYGSAFHDTILQSAKEFQLQRINNHKQRITTQFDYTKKAAVLMARSAAMENYLKYSNSVKSETSVRFKNLLQQEILAFATASGANFSQLRLVDNNGQEQIRVERIDNAYTLVSKIQLGNRSSEVYFAKSRNLNTRKTVIFQSAYKPKSNKTALSDKNILHFATPIFNSNRKTAGIFVIDVAVNSFANALGNDMLIGSSGDYLYRPVSNIQEGVNSKDGNFKTQYPGNWQTILDNSNGSIYESGGEFLSSFAKLEISAINQNWYVVAREPQSEILASLSNISRIVLTILGISIFATIIVAYLISRSITKPLNKLITVIKRVTNGDEQARANISSRDEFAELGKSFDSMVEERISTLHHAEQENEALNDSIIELMEATSKLSENDLSIKISVREDVTGVVADGLNKMVTETAKILIGIKQVSHDVQQAAESVKGQGDRVTEVAREEREVVEETLLSLNKSAKTMTEIADIAQSCNDLADKSSISTEHALAKVNNTVEGMNDIRETISETEKRIKRLGERSQEITSVVEIINNISERTHVLALNASMQAAAAGEAGRGFAVVADEVQRLAESSRDSTSQIATLIHSIQTETSETMATMNRTISQVVSGSELAEQSGKQMQETLANTRELVAVVEKIAQLSAEQAKFSEVLRDNAAGIQQSTDVTAQELGEQTKHTINLVEYALRLKDAVDVFKLPKAS